MWWLPGALKKKTINCLWRQHSWRCAVDEITFYKLLLTYLLRAMAAKVTISYCANHQYKLLWVIIFHFHHCRVQIVEQYIYNFQKKAICIKGKYYCSGKGGAKVCVQIGRKLQWRCKFRPTGHTEENLRICCSKVLLIQILAQTLLRSRCNKSQF